LPCGRRRCRGTGYDFAAEPPLAGAAGGSPDGSAYVVKIPGSADVFFSEPSAEERLAGSMTDPPALAFANGINPSQAQSTAYAAVYPLTMCLRIIAPQIILALLWVIA